MNNRLDYTEKLYTTASGQIRVRWLRNNAVQVTHIKSGNIHSDRLWLKHILVDNQPVSTEPHLLKTAFDDECIRFTSADGLEILRELRPPVLGIKKRIPYLDLDIPKTALQLGLRRIDNGVRLTFRISQDESFYGWGEWFNKFQRKSGSLILRIRDAIAMIQGKSTYSAIPFFLSSRGYALWLLNSHTSQWQIDTDRMEMQVNTHGPGADYILIYGPRFKTILETYTSLTGRPPLLPKWAFGLFVTGYPQEDQDIVLSRVEEHRSRRIPLDGVILDYHWEERYHNFKWRKSIIPDPSQFIEQLRKRGIRLGLIQTPFLNNRNRSMQKSIMNHFAQNIPTGIEQDDERALPEYKHAADNDYFAHRDAKWWFGAGGMLDFSNPSASAWWNSMMKPLYEQGVAFFKNDDGEYLPEDAISALGMDGREYHNIYGFYYGKALYEGMEQMDNRRGMIYARSVWAGSQRYPAIFLGDQKPTFNGIRSTLRAGLNLGLLGFAYWTADVFGLDGETTPDVHMRYAQWALMVPVARYFWRPPEIDDTRFPWSHNEQAEENFRYYTNLRYRLLPYYYALAWESFKSGIPIMRPPILEYQDDPRFSDVYDQVMLGESIMLCPVVEQEFESRKIILPVGTWYLFRDVEDIRAPGLAGNSESWSGPEKIEIDAPVDFMPILVKGSSIIPMSPLVQHITDEHQFDEVQLNIWPPYPAEGLFYEDDGRTRAYQRGDFSLIRITAEKDEHDILITIPAAEGNYPEQPVSRQIELALHHTPLPDRIYLNDQEITDLTHSIEFDCVTMKFVHETNRTSKIKLKY